MIKQKCLYGLLLLIFLVSFSRYQPSSENISRGVNISNCFNKENNIQLPFGLQSKPKNGIYNALTSEEVENNINFEYVDSDSLPAIVRTIHRGNSDIFSIPFDRYQKGTGEIAQYPVGVFDSGIGGLTVLEGILEIDHFNNATHKPNPDGKPDFMNERFIYLGDQANMPYGNYPSEGKTDFLRELIIKDGAFLLGNRYWPSTEAGSPKYNKSPVKAIVIACNTATAYGLEDLKKALRIWDVPVYIVGVVEAGATGAINFAKERNADGGVAVMATVGTCKSEGYVREIESAARKNNIGEPPVIQQGCLGLAGAIEGESSYISSKEKESRDYRGPAINHPVAPIDTSRLQAYGFAQGGLLGTQTHPETWKLNSVQNYIRYHTTTLVEHYRQDNPGEPISTVILGCTHFPFYTDQIRASFQRLRNLTLKDGSQPYHSLISDSLIFIDPARYTAMQLYRAMEERELLLKNKENSLIRTDEFYLSVPHKATDQSNLNEEGGFVYDYKYGREPGLFDREYVKRVPLRLDILSQPTWESIKNGMSKVWEHLLEFNQRSPRSIEK